jgi:hypothetical protein
VRGHSDVHAMAEIRDFYHGRNRGALSAGVDYTWMSGAVSLPLMKSML